MQANGFGKIGVELGEYLTRTPQLRRCCRGRWPDL
jgi:hypothetical protein